MRYSPAARLAFDSLAFSPSIVTPPCTSSRRASLLEAASPVLDNVDVHRRAGHLVEMLLKGVRRESDREGRAWSWPGTRLPARGAADPTPLRGNGIFRRAREQNRAREEKSPAEPCGQRPLNPCL